MSFLFWVVLGFMGGTILSKNTQQMSQPTQWAALFAMFVGCGIMFWVGYKGKSTAVATAVATATAIANANANANAKSVASSAINLYLGQQAGVTSEIIESIVDHSAQQIANSRHTVDMQHIDSRETA